MPTLDEYGNPVLFRLNASEMFENREVAARDGSKFHFGTRTKVSAVSVKGVADQLRLIAKILEESKVEKVTFTLTVDEATSK
jgi:hypothetical protein